MVAIHACTSSGANAALSSAGPVSAAQMHNDTGTLDRDFSIHPYFSFEVFKL